MTILIKRKPYTPPLSKYFDIVYPYTGYTHAHTHLFSNSLSNNTGITCFQKASKRVKRTRTRGHITPSRSLITLVPTACMQAPRNSLLVWLLRQYVYIVALVSRIFCLFKQHPLRRSWQETSLPHTIPTFRTGTPKALVKSCTTYVAYTTAPLACTHIRNIASKRCNAENNDTSLIVSGVH